MTQRREEYHKEEKSITRKNDMFVNKQIMKPIPSPLLGFARRTEAPHAPSPGRQSWRASRGVSSPSTQAPAAGSAQSSTLRLRHASRPQWRIEPTPPPPRPPARPRPQPRPPATPNSLGHTAATPQPSHLCPRSPPAVAAPRRPCPCSRSTARCARPSTAAAAASSPRPRDPSSYASSDGETTTGGRAVR